MIYLPYPFKVCIDCKQHLPATLVYWSRHKASPDRLQYRCKQCASSVFRDWRSKNQEKEKARAKDWHEQHKVQDREYARQWRLTNAQHIHEKNKEWRMENAEYDRARKIQWRSRNPAYSNRWQKNNADKMRSYQHRRRARKRTVPNTITPADIQYALNYFKGCCAVCGRPLNGLWHTVALDHWIPLSDINCPGSVPTNEVPLCHGVGGCNNSKADADPHDWLLGKYGKRKASKIEKRVQEFFSSLEKVVHERL